MQEALALCGPNLAESQRLVVFQANRSLQSKHKPKLPQQKLGAKAICQQPVRNQLRLQIQMQKPNSETEPRSLYRCFASIDVLSFVFLMLLVRFYQQSYTVHRSFWRLKLSSHMLYLQRPEL